MEQKRDPFSFVVLASLLAISSTILSACNPFSASIANYRAEGNSAVFWPEELNTSSKPPLAAGGNAPINSRVTVGILLPVSGEHAQIGSEMRQAALMAIEEVSNSGIRFGIVDTRSTTEGALSATATAINAGANVILGPLLSDSVRKSAQLTLPRGVAVIGYTNDVTTAKPGVFPLGLAPEQSVRRMMRWASDNNYQRIALMWPETAYGQAAQAAALRFAMSYGIQITEQVSYGQDDVSKNQMAQELALRQDNFDAILIPDAGNALREVSSLLYFYEVEPEEKKFMGLEGWDDAQLATEQSLIGGVYAAPPSERLEHFEERYKSRYGSKPSIQSAAVYDSVRLAGELGYRQKKQSPNTQFGIGSHPFTVQNLTRPQGFSGVLGLYRLTKTGRIERLLDVKAITTTGARVIEPAEKAFNIFGFLPG